MRATMTATAAAAAAAAAPAAAAALFPLLSDNLSSSGDRSPFFSLALLESLTQVVKTAPLFTWHACTPA